MITTKRRRPARAAGLLGALAITAGALLSGLPAHADEPGAPAAPTEAPKVDLVLDVSGSMRATDIEGKSRISVAQQSLNDVIDALPAETDFGIRTLGATYPGNDKNEGCKDTKQLFPVGKTDKVEAKTAVATLRPTGWTPIGLALRGAAQDLGTGPTTRRIVLITDGEDSCAPPDPCDVARELAAQGIHLVVDTLGLAHDDKTRQQLLCIANATGGTFTDVRTQAQLTQKVKQLVGRAGDTHSVTPAKAAGTDKCETAPLLAPGVYSDREKFSEHRVYRVPVKPARSCAPPSRSPRTARSPVTTACCCRPPTCTGRSWSAAPTRAAAAPTWPPPASAGPPRTPTALRPPPRPRRRAPRASPVPRVPPVRPVPRRSAWWSATPSPARPVSRPTPACRWS